MAKIIRLSTDFSPRKAQHRRTSRPIIKGYSLVALFVGGLFVYASIIILSTMLLPSLQDDSRTTTPDYDAYRLNNTAKRNALLLMPTTATHTHRSSQEQVEYWKHMLEKARAEFPHNPHHQQNHSQQQHKQQQQQQGPALTSRQQWYPGHHVMVYHHNHSFGRRPPLSSLINKTHILVDPYFTDTNSSRSSNNNNNNNNSNSIYNVSWLLDFAIIGFGKSGTSSVLYWLSQQENVAAFTPEVWDLMLHQPHKLVDYLYRDLPYDDNDDDDDNERHHHHVHHWHRGYKGPSDVTQPHVIQYFRDYFPQTKLIVGLRHPIRFFESLYNFRIQNYIPNNGINNNNDTTTTTTATATAMPHPNKLIGRCVTGMQYTCTEKSNFAYYLLRLGKTTRTSANSTAPSRLAQEIVGYFKSAWYNLSNVPYTPNPVFLYHMEQLNRPALARDLLEYLNLSSSSSSSSSSTTASILNSSTTSTSTTMLHARPGKEWTSQKIQNEKNAQKIDICRDEYIPLRRDLLRIGRQSARWIQDEFLHSPDVTCSERDDIFLPLLQSWQHDPCSNTTEIIAPVGDFMKMGGRGGGGRGGPFSFLRPK